MESSDGLGRWMPSVRKGELIQDIEQLVGFDYLDDGLWSGADHQALAQSFREALEHRARSTW